MSVLVYTENWDGKFKKLSYELVSYASSLADILNTTVTAVTIGKADEGELKKLGEFGATKIMNIICSQLTFLDNQAFAKIIAETARKENTEIIIFSNNNTGKALAPRVAVRLKAGLASGVNRLPSGTDPFVVSKRSFSGNAYAHIVVKTPIKVITLSQNSFDLIKKPTGAVPVTTEVEFDGQALKTKVSGTHKQTGKIVLTDADIVVSGGRGMKSPDNWGPLVELADLLGGATACSRPVSDEGWRPHEEHTGQTGKIIAPNLYIAVGISGATQHLAGVSSSRYIVAINSDKDAPIFEASQYGIVGDAMKVLPKLVEKVRSIRK
ncbi:MAG: electron transfer flavoprotein subunit alpha/FixB family protein [Bacteroidales bacterium]|nr:electron transfer flavoprotein subunit alpha/FixB family protein [Bacteroidales bacterium]